MTLQINLTVLTCLLAYMSSANAIMVKYGTKEGPIEPPTPEPVIVPVRPYRSPAPVWEERPDDTPDPNAQWRPRPFIPQPMYTKVAYNQPEKQQPQHQPKLNNAQRFANSYLPKHRPIPAQPILNYFTPAQLVSQLSSQSLPGIGIRYFVPAYAKELVKEREEKRQEDAKHNDLETNEVSDSQAANSDLQWTHEKEAAKRTVRNSHEGSFGQRQFVYQWPAFVHRQQ